MTETATCRHVGSVARSLARWIARLHRQLSDCVFADGDAFAREHEWQITKTTGRFGFGARSYRDPRFGQRPAAPPSDSEPSASLRQAEAQPQPGSNVVRLDPPAAMRTGWSAPQARYRPKKGGGERTGA
jgi:hypothetical protein